MTPNAHDPGPGSRPHSRLYSRWDHQDGSDALLVFFNGYAHLAEGASTRLDCFKWLSSLGTSTLWFAEGGELGWYSDFDKRIQATVRLAAKQPGIRRVVFVGASAGGHAAIRHAALLHDIDAELQAVSAIAVNPQTDFSSAVLQGIRQRLAGCGWPAAQLGRDPIVPAPGRIEAPSSLCTLLAQPRLRADITHISVYYDAANPIDSGFALALPAASGLRLQPRVLAQAHGEGCGTLLRSSDLRWAVHRALGVASAPPLAGSLRAGGPQTPAAPAAPAQNAGKAPSIRALGLAAAA